MLHNLPYVYICTYIHMFVCGHLSPQSYMALFADISCFGWCNNEESIAGKEMRGAGRTIQNSSVLLFPSKSNNKISMYLHQRSQFVGKRKRWRSASRGSSVTAVSLCRVSKQTIFIQLIWRMTARIIDTTGTEGSKKGKANCEVMPVNWFVCEMSQLWHNDAV